MTLKAIETVYNGYRFRSRLEARWALFFSELGIKWQYEKEGYNLDGLWYLPDFWLPQFNAWIEVKNPESMADADVWLKANLLFGATNKEVWIVGELWPDAAKLHICDAYEGEVYNDGFIVQCRKCPTMRIECPNGYGAFCCDSERAGWLSALIELSYEKARQARFEHSERKAA